MGEQVPRRAKGPRLYLDRKRREWIIRDGKGFGRTGCAEGELAGAEQFLAQYIARKYRPEASGSPLIADVLLAYRNEVIPTKKTSRNMIYNIGSLEGFWGDKRVSDVTAANCRAYMATKTQSAALVHLKRLRAAIHHWHKEHGPLAILPSLTLPQAPGRRTRWLERSEAAKLLWAARRVEYQKRRILLGLHTGSRPGVILALKWSWIDFKSGVMNRREEGESESDNKKKPPVKLGKKILGFLKRWQKMDHIGDGTNMIANVVHYNGQQIDDPHGSWKRLVRLAKLKGKVTPHTLRHTRATWLMQKGRPPWQVAGHLGMSIKTLQDVYSHHHPDYGGGVEND